MAKEIFKEKTVKDVMIPIENYAIVRPDATLQEAIMVLRQSYFVDRVRKNAIVKVVDIMLRVKGSIDSGADLLDALKLIFKNRITKLPVYEKDRLVGVIRDTDIFITVSNILTQE